MTIRQIQLLLEFLGYSPGGIDGAAGPQTTAAVKAFQTDYGLTPDGDPGAMTQKALRGAVAGTMEPVEKPKTGTWWDEIAFFTREEFPCTCHKYCDGFPVEPDELLVRVCDEIRRRAGVPIGIIQDGGSGIRCPQHNKEVRGADNSEHMYGRAADLHPHGISPEKLRDIAVAVTAEMCPGKGGIGIYNWGCHVDVGKFTRWDERK